MNREEKKLGDDVFHVFISAFQRRSLTPKTLRLTNPVLLPGGNEEDLQIIN